jgi:hypothetical protein
MSNDFHTRQALGLSHLRQNQRQAAYDHVVALARRCRELLDGNKWQENALQKADLFRQQMDVRAIYAPVIEATVKAMGG